ncbi:MAG: hypothetical protein ACLRM3_05235, partial [Subdoligranulum sp.]
GICRTSLAVSALRIMRYCLIFFCAKMDGQLSYIIKQPKPDLPGVLLSLTLLFVDRDKSSTGQCFNNCM